ncbi:class I SAM-dependent methyltransferase [Wenxinia marina]|uniref:Methyltransferase domain protein n=1 Tax=Wenxinia marina DSM 24838 TaxID=1123501 RepID=A0A0D0Q7R1_9RHOB|nr:class I SAM-dependent methyltransferase [Wenxinia marina]KIQ70504.1 Methyltransferase domain protein [Wenxinia marina DSM 24838]GGL52608.1 hypothetical protein GCM10011392_03710 [Wenxinia marina]
MTDDAAMKDRIEAEVKRQVQRFRQSARGITPRECPICGWFGTFTAFGDPPRFDARCAKCQSLERHRLFRLYADRNRPFEPHHVVLHFAPEKQLGPYIKDLVARYETADLSERRRVTHRVNIERTGLPSEEYDRIVCNHVLEHVDDRRALSEIFRMLKPGGIAFLMTPVCEGWARTYEDPDVTEASDRRVHFGQNDHVRYYGRDLRDRIRAAGFDLAEYTAVEPDVLTYGLMRGETLFIGTKPL